MDDTHTSPESRRSTLESALVTLAHSPQWRSVLTDRAGRIKLVGALETDPVGESLSRLALAGVGACLVTPGQAPQLCVLQLVGTQEREGEAEVSLASHMPTTLLAGVVAMVGGEGLLVRCDEGCYLLQVIDDGVAVTVPANW